MNGFHLLSFLAGGLAVVVAPIAVWGLWRFSERVWLYLTNPAPRFGQMLTSGLGGRVYRVYHVERGWLWWTAEADPFLIIYGDTPRLEPDIRAGEYPRLLDPRRMRRLKPYTPPELAPIFQRAEEAR